MNGSFLYHLKEDFGVYRPTIVPSRNRTPYLFDAVKNEREKIEQMGHRVTSSTDHESASNKT